MRFLTSALAAGLLLAGACHAQQSATVVPANIIPQPGQVVASGTVPDEKTKSDVLRKLQSLYGLGNVIDQIEVGGVVAPANWAQHLDKLISEPLRSVHRGQIEIDGTQIRLRGEVANEATRQKVASALATSLNPTYRIANGLHVVAEQSEQARLDRTLADRIVEFRTGSATLTTEGQKLLDEVADVLPQISSQRIQIIGHTDSSGSRATNLALSQARADAVKNYLVGKGQPDSRFEAVGVGPDQPVASNTTADGRGKNRRIEFRASN
jgi:OOP family OmpA-OmpF porin